MLDSAAPRLEKIRLGEDSLLECKAWVFAGGKVKGPRRNEVADELVAFGSARGGVLGVDDATRVRLSVFRRSGSIWRYDGSLVSQVHNLIKPLLFPLAEQGCAPRRAAAQSAHQVVNIKFAQDVVD